MTQNVGAIKYTVEAETGDLLNAEKVVDKTTDSMARDFKKVDVAAKETTVEINKSAKAIKVALIGEQKAAERAAAAIVRIKKKETDAFNKSAAKKGRAMGQTGIQIQQFVGQVQGGQNALLAFSQQAADIGIVSGHAMIGVVLGIAASIAGILLPSLFNGKKAMEDLEKVTEELGKTFKETADGSDILSTRILHLAKQSKGLARIEISKGIQNSEAQIKHSITAITDAIDEGGFSFRETFSDTFNAVTKSSSSSFKEILTNTRGFTASLDKGLKGATLNEVGAIDRQVRSLQKEFKITKEQAIKLSVAVSDVFTEKSALSVKMLENNLADLNDTTGGTNKKIVDLASSLVPFFQSTTKGVNSANLLRQAFSDINKVIEDTGDVNDKSKDKVKSLTQSLEQQMIALRDGEEAAFRYATRMNLGLTEVEKMPEAIDAQISALFRLKAAQDATSKETKEKKQLETQVQGLGVSAEDQIKMRLEKELELLRLAQEQKIEIEGTYQERRVELQAQADEKIANLNKKTAEESILNYEALENQIIGTFASIATGAQDGKEAIRSLAQSILTQMIGALIKMGVQAMIGQTTSAAVTSASMGAIAAAAAPAAALVSLATAGANAPLATAGMAAAGAAATAMSFSGRQFGGGVSGGNAYRMGENGPEILKQGNKNIVIPGENGKVIPNGDLGGGGVTVNVNNMAPGVDVQATPSPDGKTIDIAVRQAVAEITNQFATGNGQAIRALKSNTNLTTRATR